MSKWPRGAKWPATVDGDGASSPLGNADSPPAEGDDFDPVSAEESVNRKLAEAQEGQIAGQQQKQKETDERGLPHSPSRASNKDDSSKSPPQATTPQSSEASTMAQSNLLSSSTPPHSSAHLWIGTSSTDGAALSSSQASELDEEALASHDGIGIIYFPLVPNKAVPDFDPLSVSTWRFDLQREESDKLIAVARANVKGGEEMVVKVLRAMWLRKRKAREEAEKLEANQS